MTKPRSTGSQILTVAAHGALDAAAARQGASMSALMARAGAAVAREIMRRWAPRNAAVLCGPGNNGGDGYVCACALLEAGWPVTVLRLAPPSSEAAAEAAAGWTGPTWEAAPERVAGAELVVDALFGAGLARPLEGVAAACVAAAGASAAPVVAVDLPSGLDGDAGHVLGALAPAALTVTFARKKPAHVLEPGRSLCGEVVTASIGHPAAALDDILAAPPRAWENVPALWSADFPWPEPATHKHLRGRLGVVTGGRASTGAARLAARAGLRAGAGLVTLFSPPDAIDIAASASTAVMTRAFADPAHLLEATRGLSALVAGPGAGLTARTRADLEALLAEGPPALVLDADALTLFAEEPQALFAALRPQDVLTPHAGEFARVCPDLDLGRLDKLSAARIAAERAGCVVLLKGPDTVIAAPDGRAAVNTHASPFLATAGSGDVLAGLIGGLLAQGVESFEAACAGAWLHGECALGLGPGLIAEDLVEAIPRALEALRGVRPR